MSKWKLAAILLSLVIVVCGTGCAIKHVEKDRYEIVNDAPVRIEHFYYWSMYWFVDVNTVGAYGYNDPNRLVIGIERMQQDPDEEAIKASGVAGGELLEKATPLIGGL